MTEIRFQLCHMALRANELQNWRIQGAIFQRTKNLPARSSRYLKTMRIQSRFKSMYIAGDFR
jgi:hypothetical protein